MYSELIKTSILKLKRILLKNRIVLRNGYSIVEASKNRVNLNVWIVSDSDNQNVGDYLSKVVVEEMCKFKGVDFSRELSSTKHLYAIGSILLGYQDSVVWGSGFGYDHSNSKLFKLGAFIHRHYHTSDIRAVRGPITRSILLKMGIDCPEVYGDPAVLMPLFYNKQVKKKEIILLFLIILSIVTYTMIIKYQHLPLIIKVL